MNTQTCLECGRTIQHDGTTKYVACPNCSLIQPSLRARIHYLECPECEACFPVERGSMTLPAHASFLSQGLVRDVPEGGSLRLAPPSGT